MMSIRGDFTEAIKRNMYEWFFEKYDKQETVHDKIFNMGTSEGAYSQSTNVQNLGDLVELPEGDDIIFEHIGEGRVIVGINKSFAKGFELSKVAVADFPKERTADIMKELAGQWADSVIRSKEKFAASFFNNGGLLAGHKAFNNSIPGVITDPTGNLGYDGKPFFALSGNNHVSLNGGTYFNSVALALTSANLTTVNTSYRSTNNRDESDEVISLRPDTLLVPPSLGPASKVILQSQSIPGSANNDINVNAGLLNPIEWDYLTDTDAWFVGAAGKGLQWRDRQMPVIDFYQDSRNKNYYATIDARWGAWMDNWRFWYGSQLSTS